MNNVTLPISSISVIDKIEKDICLISGIFGNAGVKSKSFVGIAKLFLANRIEDTVSVRQLLPTSSKEKLGLLGIGEEPSERSIYRGMQRIDRLFPILIERYYDTIKKRGLVGENQIADFSSSYFEGTKAELAYFGYSTDHRSDKKQIAWGISTGINGVPTALTTQKGNIPDKTHMRAMLKMSMRIVDKGSLFMYDCSGNSPWLKDNIVDNAYNYLTLKAKKVRTYKKHILSFEKDYKK